MAYPVLVSSSDSCVGLDGDRLVRPGLVDVAELQLRHLGQALGRLGREGTEGGELAEHGLLATIKQVLLAPHLTTTPGELLPGALVDGVGLGLCSGDDRVGFLDGRPFDPLRFVERVGAQPGRHVGLLGQVGGRLGLQLAGLAQQRLDPGLGLVLHGAQIGQGLVPLDGGLLPQHRGVPLGRPQQLTGLEPGGVQPGGAEPFVLDQQRLRLDPGTGQQLLGLEPGVLVDRLGVGVGLATEGIELTQLTVPDAGQLVLSPLPLLAGLGVGLLQQPVGLALGLRGQVPGLLLGDPQDLLRPPTQVVEVRVRGVLGPR